MRRSAPRNLAAAPLVTKHILKNIKDDTVVIRVADVGIPLSSFKRYLYNPLFNPVANSQSTTFSLRWCDKLIECAYGKLFAQTLGFNKLLRDNPKIVECILRLWTDHPAKGMPRPTESHRQTVGRNMKYAMDKLYNDFSLFKRLYNPFHHAIMRPCLFDEIPRRKGGEHILLQYVIKPAGGAYTNDEEIAGRNVA